MNKEIFRVTRYLAIVCFITIGMLECGLRAIKALVDNERAFYDLLNLHPDKNYWAHLLNQIHDNGYHSHDYQLGWSISSNATTEDGLYKSNSSGLRSLGQSILPCKSEKLRIALFGDSFTHGDEVSYSDTWGFHLETNLKAYGIECEVLNFGVSGYGTDQALLRYLTLGLEMKPDLVILGFQIENFWRNLNVLRPKYVQYSGIPFSKPFTQLVNDSLVFKNCPTFGRDSLLKLIISGTNNDGLLKYDYFNQNQIYCRNFPFSWLFSAKLLHSRLHSINFMYPTLIDDCNNGQDIMNEIIKAFNFWVTKNQGEFIILQLPNQYEIESCIKNGQHPNDKFLNDLFDGHTVCRTDSMLLNHAHEELFLGHYTPIAHKLIGEYFANYIYNNYQITSE